MFFKELSMFYKVKCMCLFLNQTDLFVFLNVFYCFACYILVYT